MRPEDNHHGFRVLTNLQLILQTIINHHSEGISPRCSI